MTPEESEEVRKGIQKVIWARNVYEMLECLEAAVRRAGRPGADVKMKIAPSDDPGMLDFVLLRDGKEVAVFSEAGSNILDYYIAGVRNKRTSSVSEDDYVRVAQVRDAPFNMTKTARRKAARAKPTWGVVVDKGSTSVKILASSEMQHHMAAFCQGYRPLPDWLDIV